MAIAEDNRIAADAIAFIEFVGHEKHCDALSAQTFNNFNKIVHFATGQRGGWLIHDDKLGACCNSARNSNQLAHGERQLGNDCIQKGFVGWQTNRAQCPFCSLAKLRKLYAAEQSAIAFNELLIQRYVFSDGQIGNK